MLGFFDSGLGGLTIVREVLKVMPEYQILYLADTARAPYGNRSQDLVYKFTEQAMDFMFKQGCQLVIIACNTASSEAIRKIHHVWMKTHWLDRKVLGVVIPLAEEAVSVTRFGRVGVVGTRGTIESGAYIRELKKQKSNIEIYQQACPLLVPLIEEGFAKRRETKMILKYYLRPLKIKRPDTLVLGCTHYHFLYREFKAVMGKSCKVLDTGDIVATKLKDYLVRHPEVETKLVKGQNHRFLATDVTAKFQKIAQDWLGREINLEKANLE